ncbi:bidirectional sugar transporter SWEET1-like [Malus domestica]|uniref:bidirectional sugar transporter SWEET1-like n=1 Tax=Malus domestica TaxID=3750 RepID=UPI0010A9B160|nr:bidirectional sugar transporter SWEET1-like [Malus domestica]
MKAFRIFGVEEVMNIPKFLFRVIFGNAIALFQFLAPTDAFKRIMMKNKFTEQFFLGIPYLMTLLNCLITTAWYCLPFVSPCSILVSTVNTIGAALESIYLLIFVTLAPKREKEKIIELLTFVLSFKQQ